MNLWQRLTGRGPKEIRESQPFTDAIVQAILQANTGASANTTATAAVEAAAGLLGRAFAGAKVEAAAWVVEGLTPSVLNLIGRDLMRRGESVWSIGISEGLLRLVPAGSWDVRGDPVGYGSGESGWWYRVDFFGPSSNTTRYLPSSAILHPRYAVDPARPWLGLSPLQWASTTARLNAEAERSLADEMGGPVAQLLAIPTDGGDDTEGDTLRNLKADITGARGRALLLETTAAGWGDGQSASPHRDWVASRLGANPPTTVNTARRESFNAVLSAMGTPPDLFDAQAAGTAQREAFRRWYSATCEPLARIVEGELEAKLETPVNLDMSGLYAHDLVGRAGAFTKLVMGGMPVDQAAATSGLLGAEGE